MKQTVFLKQLVEGDANLYYYHDNDIIQFFIQTKNDEPTPLIYKRYKASNQSIGKNSLYKKQLFDLLKCDDITLDQTKKLKYFSRELIDIVVSYNMCKSSTSKKYEDTKKKLDFNFTPKLGYFSSTLEVDYSEGDLRLDRLSANFGTSSSIRIAAELEYMLSSKTNKWSIFIEPGYQSYKGSSTTFDDTALIQNRRQDAEVDYSYIDIPVGVRYYFFLSENSKIFLNAAYVLVFDLSDKIDYSEGSEVLDLDIKSETNLAFGLGYQHNNKYSIEARLNTQRDITSDYVLIKSNFSSIGLVLGYKIF
ncbi:hypothetical protein [Psychroserpens sp.]|uniref:hypothetical protein n=1 Tax=Psychroserpens sp. TaxID=2020870 RepID=UPI0038590FE4